MKIRNGFVSNSSSSSFICEVCEKVESGMDCCPEDFNMTMLPCGHLICKDHIDDISEEDFKKSVLEEIKKAILKIKYKKKSKYKRDSLKKLYNDMVNSENFGNFRQELYRDEFNTEYVRAQCPICAFSSIRDKDILNYFIKTSSFTKEEIIVKVRESLVSGDLKLL